MLLFAPLLVTAAATLIAYAAITGLRLPAADLVAAGALVLDFVTALIAVYLVWPEDLPFCTRHPYADAGVVLGWVAAVLGGVAFGGTLAATDRHPASAIVAVFVVPVPYVVFFVALSPGAIC